MGSHVSTDVVPFTMEDIAYTQQELMRPVATAGGGSVYHANLSPRAATATGSGGGNSPMSGGTGGSGAGGTPATPVPTGTAVAADYNSATALPGEVIDRFDGIDHNIKIFRLFYRPTTSGGSSAGAAGSSSATTGGNNPPSPFNSSHVHNDPVQLSSPAAAAAPVLPGGRRGPGSAGATGDRRRSTPRGGYAPAVAGGGGYNDPIISSHVRIEPLLLSTAHVKVRPTEVYLVIHVQRLPTAAPWLSARGPSVSPNAVSPREEPSPRTLPTAGTAAGLGGRQWAEDAEAYGADRTPPWAAQVADVVTPRGLSVPFASDIGKPAVATYAAAAAMGGGNSVSSLSFTRSPRSAPSTNDRTGEFQYSIHLLTGKRAHPLTAAVAVLHALQVERRFAECPELARRLFFNCNLARVPTGGNPTSSVAGIERNRVNNMLVVTRPVQIGLISVEGSDSNGGSARSQTAADGGSGGGGGVPSAAAASSTAVTFVGPPLSVSYAKNALLRLFHCARVAVSSPRISPPAGGVSVPTSARYSISSTPRGGPGGSTAPGGGYAHKAPTPTTAITNTREPQMQGPPALEIPKLRTSIMPVHRPDSRRGTPREEPAVAAAAPTPTTTAKGGGESGERARDSKRRSGQTKSSKAPRSTPKHAGSRGTLRREESGGSAAGEGAGPTASSSSSAQASPDQTESPPHGERQHNGVVVAAPPPAPSSSSTGPPALADLRLSEVLDANIRHGNADGDGAGAAVPTARRAGGATSQPEKAAAAHGAAESKIAPLPLMNLAKRGRALGEGENGGIAGRSGREGDGRDAHSHCSLDDLEVNEQRMSEDRVLRLRQAAPEATEILPWLFVGGEEAAKDRAQLLEKGVTAVVNTVAFDLPNYHEDVFRYLPLCVCDAPDEPIFSLFPLVNRFVDLEKEEHGGKVFIHCHQGVSRSCSFVIAYVMWKDGMCYDRAYELVRSRRKVCSPNTGFYVNLHLWEDQLVKPVFNKAYAYVPYSPVYAFPFSFRLALTFRKNASLTHDDDDASIITPYTQVVEEGGTCVLDTRVFYGFILGERPATAAVKAAPLYSFSFSGRRCDPVVTQRAQQEWLSFVNYSFYQGPKRVSVNDKTEALHFLPLAPLDTHSFVGTTGPSTSTAVVTSALDAADVVRRVGKHMFTSSSRGTAFTVKEERYDRFEPLFKHEKLIFAFAVQLEEEAKADTACETRKRAREEEIRRRGVGSGRPARSGGRSPGTTPHSGGGATSDGSRTAKSMGSTSSNGSNGTSRHQQPRQLTAALAKTATPPAAPRAGEPSPRSLTVAPGLDARHPPSTSVGNGNANAATPFLNLKLPNAPADSGSSTTSASAAASAALQLPRRAATDDGEALLPPITDVVVFRFPFDEGPLQSDDEAQAAAILLEDLEPEDCYAIIAPDTGAGAVGNRVFLWVGAQSHVEREELWQAFFTHLAVREDEEAKAETGKGPLCVVRLPGRRPLLDVLPEVVAGGEEPDELLLVM